MSFLFFFLIWNFPLELEAEPKEKTNKKYAPFWVGGGAPDYWQLANCDDFKFCGM